MESMTIDEKVMINKLKFTESGSLKTNKQGSPVTTPTAMGRKEIAQMIEKIKTTDPTGQKALEDLFNQRKVMNEKASIDEDKERKAIRIRLNLQKAIMLAQMEAKKAQIDIKEKYFKQSNMIEAQTKILGGLISEEQKARLNYNKSLMKNAETREAAEKATRDTMRLGILQDVKAGGAGLEQALKQELFKGENVADVSTLDLTSKLEAMKYQEILDLMLRIANENEDARQISAQRTAELNAQISILDKQKTLNDNIATAEYKTNDAIAKRKGLMQDVNREMQEYIRGLDYAAQKEL